MQTSGGLRTVALFEAAKGLLVLLVGLGLARLFHHDAQAVAERLVRMMHLNPAARYPRIFLDAAQHVTNARLWVMALAATAYATVRFVEAWGLWRGALWAGWFGALSGSIYLPIELFEIARRPTPLRFVVFGANLLVVAYLAWLLVRQGRPRGRDA